jgi:hypothetical protein
MLSGSFLKFTACCLVLCVFMQGCSLGEKAFLSVRFPPSSGALPDACKDKESWSLVYWDGTGDRKTCDVSYSEGGSISLEVMKENPVLCLLIPPEVSEHFAFRPAGGLYVPGEPLVLKTDWLAGAGADFLLRSAEGGLNLSALNLRRLASEMVKRGEPDPWSLDWDLIGKHLAEKSMRSWYIRKKHPYDLDALFPPGKWISQSFWLDPVVSNGAGAIPLELCEGIHSFYDETSSVVFTITVDRNGESFFVLYDS